MDTELTTNEQRNAPDAGREWYAEHRADVVARLAESAACGSRRAAALLVLAFDDDPATVARARVVRGAGP